MSPHDGGRMGRLLREYRHRNDLTIEALAGLSGVSLRTISDVERGIRRVPHLHTLEALCKALALPPEESEEILALPSRVTRNHQPWASPLLALPRIAPDFYGREMEIKQAVRVLGAGGSPVLAITGMPGLGKTTLGVTVVRSLTDQFEKIVFLEMAGQNETRLTPQEAARKLVHAIIPAFPSLSDDEVVSQYQGALVGRKILIFCDDVENETQIRCLLPAQSESAMILTSRRRLSGLDGVTRIHLTPFSPEDSTRFLEAIIPETQRNTADTRALAMFCQGLPLALRIAGNQVAAHPDSSAGSLSARLSSRPDQGISSLNAGDRSLFATFELSYERLDPEQQLVLRRLGIADSTHTSVEMISVLADLPENRTLQILDELTDLSAISFDDDGKVFLHDLATIFVQTKIEVGPGIESIHERVDSYLLSKVAAAGWWFRFFATQSPDDLGLTILPMPSFTKAFSWLLTEQTGWLEALQRAHDKGEHALVVMIVSHLHWFTRLCPNAHRWDELYDLAARSAEEVGDDRHSVLNWGEVAWFLLTYQRDVPRAATALETAKEAAKRLGNLQYTAWNLFARARLEHENEELDLAMHHCSQAVSMFEELTDLEGLSYAYPLKAEILSKRGKYQEALQVLDTILQILEETTQLEAHVRALAWLNTMRIKAVSLRHIGDLDACITTSTQAIEKASFFRGHPVMQTVLLTRGSAYKEIGDESAAAQDLHAVENPPWPCPR